MPEVLRLDVPGDAVRQLAAPSAVLDPLTRGVIDAEVAAARATAYAEGEAAGRASASEVAAAAVAAVRSSVEEVMTELAGQRRAAAEVNLDLALRLATAVLDATPPDDAVAILDRVRRTVELLDGDQLEVRVRPEHRDVLEAGLADDRRLRVVADPSLPEGGARLVGTDGGAELTRQALFAAASELLAGDQG